MERVKSNRQFGITYWQLFEALAWTEEGPTRVCARPLVTGTYPPTVLFSLELGSSWCLTDIKLPNSNISFLLNLWWCLGFLISMNRSFLGFIYCENFSVGLHLCYVTVKECLDPIATTELPGVHVACCHICISKGFEPEIKVSFFFFKVPECHINKRQSMTLTSKWSLTTWTSQAQLKVQLWGRSQAVRL